MFEECLHDGAVTASQVPRVHASVSEIRRRRGSPPVRRPPGCPITARSEAERRPPGIVRSTTRHAMLAGVTDQDNNGTDSKGAKKRKLRPLVGLHVGDFRHPNDARATDALARIPGLDKVMAKVLEYGLERLYYVDNV